MVFYIKYFFVFFYFEILCSKFLTVLCLVSEVMECYFLCSKLEFVNLEARFSLIFRCFFIYCTVEPPQISGIVFLINIEKLLNFLKPESLNKSRLNCITRKMISWFYEISENCFTFALKLCITLLKKN